MIQAFWSGHLLVADEDAEVFCVSRKKWKEVTQASMQVCVCVCVCAYVSVSVCIIKLTRACLYVCVGIDARGESVFDRASAV